MEDNKFGDFGIRRVKELTELSLQGDSSAMYSLGDMYFSGKYVDKDYTKSMEWYQKAADAGNINAKAALGLFYRMGLGVEANYVKAKEFFEQAAAAGSNDAMFFLGDLYYTGAGVDKNYKMAYEWYKKAADKNQKVAMYVIADMFLKGTGIEKDYKKAYEWYQKSAVLGYTKAMISIGILYTNGTAVEQDDTLAFSWFQKASKMGDLDATVLLGNMYENGKGTELDYKKAFECYQKGADGENQRGKWCLANAYFAGHGVKKDYRKAYNIFRQMADAGDAQAMCSAGYCIYHGFGIETDKNKAMEWLQKSANLGYPPAMKSLGDIYFAGNDTVKKDLVKACEWYGKASEKDHRYEEYYKAALSKKENIEALQTQLKPAIKKYIENFSSQNRSRQEKLEKSNYTIEELMAAAKAGHSEAMYQLGLAYFTGNDVDGDIPKAYEWYQKAADLGHVDAMMALADGYRLGKGIQRDDEKAFHLYDRLAEVGCVDAYNPLATYYYLGQGVERNLDKACEFYQKSLDCGGVPDSYFLKALNERQNLQKLQNQKTAAIEKNIEYLENLHLSASSLKSFETYFRYMGLKSKNNIDLSFRFLIHTDSISDAAQLEQALFAPIKEKHSNAMLGTFTEDNLMDKIEDRGTGFLEKYAMISIQMSTVIFDESISSEKARKHKWEAVWRQIANFFEKNPELVVSIYGKKQLLKERFHEDDKAMSHFYYRVMRCHIYFNSWGEEEILDELCRQLKDKGFSLSDDFMNGIRDYIHAVYKKADLTGKAFVTDLTERIYHRYFRGTELNNQLDANCVPYYHKPITFEEATEELNSLVGLTRVKEAFKEIAALCSGDFSWENVGCLHMIFSGNAGTGKTTVAQMAANILYSLGIIESNKVLTVSSESLIGKYVGGTAPLTIETCRKAYGGILFVDEAYLLDPSGHDGVNSEIRNEGITTLLREMEDNRDKFIVILAGYPDRMETMLKNIDGLSSRINRVVNFDDFTEDELVKIFENLCVEKGYSIDSDAFEILHKKFKALMYEPNFGNARGVRKVFYEIEGKYKESGREDKKIRSEYVTVETQSRSYDELLNELKGMTGLKEVKEQIELSIATAKMNKLLGVKNNGGNNMLFLGNPGTGKTTVANLYSQMLYSLEITKSPKIRSITAHEVVSGNSGTSADKLREACNEAMGGVLFIDEAYTLADNPSVFSSCSAVLLDVLENKRDDIVIILAGYEREMKNFLAMNPGLASRFERTVHFTDYSTDELCEMFVSAFEHYENTSFTIKPEALEKFKEQINLAKNAPQFGNGRTVRNAVSRTFQRHAMNYYSKSLDETELLVISAEDIDVEI